MIDESMDKRAIKTTGSNHGNFAVSRPGATCYYDWGVTVNLLLVFDLRDGSV
jgi:hypothetical protein